MGRLHLAFRACDKGCSMQAAASSTMMHHPKSVTRLSHLNEASQVRSGLYAGLSKRSKPSSVGNTLARINAIMLRFPNMRDAESVEIVRDRADKQGGVAPPPPPCCCPPRTTCPPQREQQPPPPPLLLSRPGEQQHPPPPCCPRKTTTLQENNNPPPPIVVLSNPPAPLH